MYQQRTQGLQTETHLKTPPAPLSGNKPKAHLKGIWGKYVKCKISNYHLK